MVVKFSFNMFHSGPFISHKLAITKSSDPRSAETIAKDYCNKLGVKLLNFEEVR